MCLFASLYINLIDYISQMKTGRLESDIKCKSCNTSLDGFSGEGSPSDGDISICAYCGSIGSYSNNVTEIIPLSEAELAKLKEEDIDQWSMLVFYQKTIQSKRKKDFDPDIQMGDTNIQV